MKKTLTQYVTLMPLILLLMFLSCQNQENHDKIYEEILKKTAQHEYPGIILGIKKPQQKMWIGAYGLSSIEEKKYMQPDDRFHIASVTKIFTATSILKLIDEHKLSLNTKVIKVLDSSLVSRIPHIEKITIQQLLDHSSGIYSFNNDLKYIETLLGSKVSENINWSAKELIALAYRENAEPLGKPGTGHYYSDVNYILLALLVEKISKIPFRNYVKQNILDPLDLKNTGFYSLSTNMEKIEVSTTVQGYLKQSEILDGFIKIHSSFIEVTPGLLNTTLAVEKIDASAGMVSTVSDLTRFGEALYLKNFLSEESLHWLLSIGEGIKNEELDTSRQGILTVWNKPYGIIFTSLGDGGAGINSILAFHPQSKSIIVGFINVFGHFNEHDFFMDQIIPDIVN